MQEAYIDLGNMETLISDLKKVMNSEIENKEKYMKMLINGFLRERDVELLTTQGVVKSFCKHCNNELCDSQTFNSTCFNCGKKPL